jgi:nucleotide-binding universal stress UspA family protein
MSRRDDQEKFERIVVAFDETPLGELALEAAAGLASALNAELAGLFVEDVELMRMAELPFARELGLISAATRPLGTSDVERAFRLQAERTRALLEEVASAFDLRWSFQVVRGQALAAALQYLSDVDVVVFGKGAHGYVARSMGIRPLAGLLGSAARRHRERFRRLTLRPIALLFDGSRRAWRTLSVAYALAATAKTRLTLLVLAEDRETFERERELVKAWLAERGAAALFVWLRNLDATGIAQIVKGEDAVALLWHDGAARQDRERFRTLLTALGCPLVLIS